MESAEKPPSYKERFIEKVSSAYARELDKVCGQVDSWSVRRPVLGISGGPDSTALLMAVQSFAGDRGIKIRPLHVNHKLRSSESEEDEEFCRNLCKKLGLELEVRSLSRPSYGPDTPSEDELRKARYSIFLDYARSIDSGLILTGHTVDDQLETMLFRLFRGTSPSGLLGMRGIRKLTPEDDIWLMRPLLDLEKVDCLKFLAACETQAREDSSNSRANYDRNYIRHHLIPIVENRFSQWKRSLLRLHDVVTTEEEYFGLVVESNLEEVRNSARRKSNDKAIYWNLDQLKEIHKAVLRRMIARQFRELDLEPSFERISYVTDLVDREDAGGAVTLSDFLEARIDKDKRVLSFRMLDHESERRRRNFLANQETEVHFPAITSDRGSCSNLVTWLNKSLRISRFGSEDEMKFPDRRALEALVDFRAEEGSVCVRMRRAGDMIQPFGMDEMVRLKKYLHSNKPNDPETLPPFQRDMKTVIVLARGEEVLWVPGYGLSEKLRTRGRPSFVMKWLDLASGGPILA